MPKPRKPKVKKRIIARRKKTPARQVKKSKLKEIPQGKKKEVFGSQETVVESAKYHTPDAPRWPSRPALRELPAGYGSDGIVLQVRDPWWLYTFWEVTAATWERFRGQLGGSFSGTKRALRVYDVTDIIFNGKNANRFFDILINDFATSWYIDTAGPGRSWCVDLGILLADGRFITVVRSNVVSTPLDGPSWITDEEWMVPDDMFARLYGRGLGFGKSSPGKGWQQGLSSPGMASMASPVKPMLKEKGFWFTLNTELIVYGATEPDAKVTIQGKGIKLRPDGTFTLRFALPEGRQTIACETTSSDKKEKRAITPVVTRETK